MDAGVTDMATLVVTPPTVLSITPAPSVNIAVKSTLDPEVIVAAEATKLVIVGAGTTVTVKVSVMATPAVLVIVSV